MRSKLFSLPARGLEPKLRTARVSPMLDAQMLNAPTCRASSAARSAICGMVLAAAATVCVAATPPRIAATSAQDAPAAASDDLYTSQVQPIFKASCYKCHGGMFHRGKLKLDTPADIMKGGHDGAVIVPGHPEQSLLLQLIRHEGPKDDPMPMPPHSKLSDADIAVVEKWIKAGAQMPGYDPSTRAAQVEAAPSK